MVDRDSTAGCKKSVTPRGVLMKSKRSIVCRGCFLTAVCVVTFATASMAQARSLRVGQTVSISIDIDQRLGLVADDIELLSQPRRPSLRGAIEALDEDRSAFKILGHWIFIDDRSIREFDGSTLGISALRVMQRLEVTCRIASDGQWFARTITVTDVKPTDKVKGTITSIPDGNQLPYRLGLQGLFILMEQGTDFVSDEDFIVSELFSDLKADDVNGDAGGYGFNIASKFFVSGSARHIYRREDRLTLELPGESQAGFSEPSARLEFLGLANDNIKFFSQLRFQGLYELHSRDLSPELLPPDVNRLQVRQAYLSVKDIGGLPVGVIVGKQRVRDPREFMFDEYLDAVRSYFYPSNFVAIEATLIGAVVPLKERLETWTDLLLQARLYVSQDLQARVYYLRRWDTDSRQRNPQYVGLSADGESKSLKGWFDLAMMTGEDKGEQQRAVAWDIGMALRGDRARQGPTLSLSLARGSGDSDPDDEFSNRFRQTGYQDNSRRHWGVTNFQSYGEVLDPELSNLYVLTIGVGVKPTNTISLDGIFHSYRLDQPTDELNNTDLLTPDAVLTGLHRDVGSELDIIFGARNIGGRLHATYKWGVFFPGPAFAMPTQRASIQRIELRIDF